jgi:hypothetical protein
MGWKLWDERRIKVSFGGLEYGMIPYEAWRVGGLSKFRTFNQALLDKWLWHFL